MKRSHRLFALLASLYTPLLVACVPDPAADLPSSEPLGEGASAVLVEAPACEGRRWVSLGQPLDCVDVAGFVAEPLFPATPDTPADLRGYCLYTWSGPDAPTDPEILAFQGAFSPGALAEDCALVVPLGAYEDHLAEQLRASIERRVGVVTGAPVPGPPVHVAVIDTTPDAPASSPRIGNNRHGDTLAELIRDVVQVPGALAVSTALALPYSTDPVTRQPVFDLNGGDYGYLSDLARALWRAVLEHRSQYTDAHFVLNLSLGWESLGPSSSCAAGMLPAAAAVRDVLDIAACQEGALIVAAAGNDMGGPSPATGLMCPAAWMTAATSCLPSRPLVLAAHGLDYNDRPLAIARAGSATPFAAPALGGVAWPKGAVLPAPLTGTSVSAAVVTASLAAVWAAAPEMSGASVTSLLRDSSPPVNVPADVCPLGVARCNVRRISPCGALAAMDSSPWACAAAVSATSTSSPELDAETRQALWNAYAHADKALATLSEDPLPSALAAAAGGQNTVFPQPVIPTCPNCAIAPGVDASISDPVFHGTLTRDVSSLTLVVIHGGANATAASTSTFRVTGTTTSIPFVAPFAAGPVYAAWISATDNVTGLPFSEQLLIVQ